MDKERYKVIKGLIEKSVDERKRLSELLRLNRIDIRPQLLVDELDEMFEHIEFSLEEMELDYPNLKFDGFHKGQPEFVVYRLKHLTEKEAKANPRKFCSRKADDLYRYMRMLQVYKKFKASFPDFALIDEDVLEHMNREASRSIKVSKPKSSAA